ncbi:hypothetical protein AB2L57_09355 [Microbacterium sp. HA-8]|uniref:hypothetical protein n=1 Tax=Microbacterium sp. HA-8 TaxID=3234200 RepID=UPI0038F820A9
MNRHANSHNILVVTEVKSDLPRCWTRLPGSGPTTVVGHDLLLSARDLLDINALLKQRLLDEWATNMGFSLAGISHREAWGKMLRGVAIDACFAAAGDPEPREIGGLLFDQVRDIVTFKRAPRMLPDLLVHMEGGCVASVLIDTFDGPLRGRDPRPHINRRLGGLTEEMMKWWPAWR